MRKLIGLLALLVALSSCGAKAGKLPGRVQSFCAVAAASLENDADSYRTGNPGLSTQGSGLLQIQSAFGFCALAHGADPVSTDSSAGTFAGLIGRAQTLAIEAAAAKDADKPAKYKELAERLDQLAVIFDEVNKRPIEN